MTATQPPPRRRAVIDAPSNLGLRPPVEGAVPGVYKLAGALRDCGLVRRLDAEDAGCVTPHHLQRLLEARGWELIPYGDEVDERGLVTSLEAAWEYGAAYGGAVFDEDDETAPLIPLCGISFDPEVEGTERIVVETAGNWGGCDRHRTHRRSVPATVAGLAELPRMLAEVEQYARAMDPRGLIECSGTGRCAEHVEQRATYRQQRLAWYEAMARRTRNA